MTSAASDMTTNTAKVVATAQIERTESSTAMLPCRLTGSQSQGSAFHIHNWDKLVPSPQCAPGFSPLAERPE